MPVDDEMIARLMEDSEPSNGNVAAPEPESTYPTYYQPARDGNSAPRTTAGEAAASVDHLLKLARELEYGLMELGESPEAVERVDSRLLANVLSDLQDDDELAPLRAAVATAQERPRDVDVMLDLVLRADAIAAVLTERDQLRSAISLFLENTDSTASNGAADEAGQVDVLDADAQVDVDDESEIDIEDVVSDSELDESVDEDSGADSVETDSGDETEESRSI